MGFRLRSDLRLDRLRPHNNQLPTIRHITTAWGRDYSDVTPLKGVIYGGGQHHAQVAVDVVALDESL
jgi:transglutaminase-like putative cysteine protease